MELEERRLSTDQIRIGMFVSGLDRPWIETPFLMQGFLVQSQHEIDTLRRYCDYVVIDIKKGRPAKSYATTISPSAPPATRRRHGPTAKHGWLAERRKSMEKRLLARRKTYRDTVLIEDEVPTARAVHDQVSHLTTSILDDIRAGRKLDAARVNETVQPLLESILRNMDAFFWISQLRRQSDQAYMHAINCCALAIAFGRHLGFPESVLHMLGVGGLLFDVGPVEAPSAAFSKPESITEAQARALDEHVSSTLDVLQQGNGLNPEILTMVRSHHERYDGGGRPDGLAGADIPLFARMLAIIDCYDALSSNRNDGSPKTPHLALQSLYKWRRSMFQKELVEQFLQCLGVYPTGSLVELMTGEVGIVMAQNHARRLRPKVMVLLGPDKTPYAEYQVVDLMDQPDDADSPGQVDIVRSLEPGAYGISSTELYL